MIEKRPIVAITIGYIIGITMGLYCKISIVFLYLFLLCIYLILNTPNKNQFKLISIKRYIRYFKIIFTKSVCIMILISSIFSNTITLYKNTKINEFFDKYNNQEIQLKAKVISNGETKKYSKKYIIKYENMKFYLNVKNNIKIEYGDSIIVKGLFIKPKERTNYKGFSYELYYKSQGIYGTINLTRLKILNNRKGVFNKIFLNIKDFIQKNFNQKISDVLLGIILGYTQEIGEDVRENFNESNASHILAVSGMHIGYLTMFCYFLLKKTGKRKASYFSILIILFYFKIVKISPSATRATVMAISILFSKLLYRKNDSWTTFSLALLCILINNPFMLLNVSLVLSFVATIWIIIFNKLFYKKNSIMNTITMTVTLTTFLIPICSVYFHKIPVLSIAISIIVGIIVGPIFILGIIYILLGNILNLSLLKKLLNFLTKTLLSIIKIGSKIPLNKAYIITPNYIEILLFYIIIFISIFLFSVFKQKKIKNKTFIKRIKNLLSLLKYRYNQNKKKVISMIIFFVFVFSIIKFIPNKLKIYFIDVGQGDACLIVTPNNKKILVDGGGSENYDVGKNTLIPYLLARRITHLDYVIISHFDTDHVRRTFNCDGRTES